MRRVSGWDLGRILDEYKAYAAPKVRECDVNYITNFSTMALANLVPNTAAEFRCNNFLRVTVFTLVVLLIWILTAPRVAISSKRSGSER